MLTIVARRGKVVTCPDCDEPLYTLTRDVYMGSTVVSASLFDPMDAAPPLTDGLPAPPCPNGHDWFGRWVRQPWAVSS